MEIERDCGSFMRFGYSFQLSCACPQAILIPCRRSDRWSSLGYLRFDGLRTCKGCLIHSHLKRLPILTPSKCLWPTMTLTITKHSTSYEKSRRHSRGH